MERQRFEESWKDSFKDAEVSPSDSLWTNIELDIEKAEGKVMKKRVCYAIPYWKNKVHYYKPHYFFFF